MLNGNFRSLPITEITVFRDERQRRQIETEDLQKSIQKIGLINPIVVKQDEEGRFVLVAGERRYRACMALKWEEIPVQFAHELTTVQANIIELEENIKRKDLPWQDLVVAVGKLHKLHVEDDEKWSQAATAEALSLTEGTVSIYLKVNGFMEDERIQKCTTVRQAYDVIDRRETRRREAAFAQLLEGDYDEDDEETYPDIFAEGMDEEDEIAQSLDKEEGDKYKSLRDKYPDANWSTAEEIMIKEGRIKVNGVWILDPNRPHDPEEVRLEPVVIDGSKAWWKKEVPKTTVADDILHTSFLEWAPSYSGSRFNFIHVDFPYGAVEVGPQMQGNEHTIYQDSPELYMELLNCFCDNLDRFFSVSGWIMFWYSERLGRETRDVFKYKCPSLEVQTHPLIWLHSDNSGISPEHKWRPRHIYDTCLLMHRGDMPLARLKSDAYAAPSDRSIHPSTKPEPMLRYFFEMIVDDQTSIFDPTCGSGAAIRAAERLGAKRVLGLEIDWQYCEAARLALKDSRAKMAIIQGIA